MLFQPRLFITQNQQAGRILQWEELPLPFLSATGFFFFSFRSGSQQNIHPTCSRPRQEAALHVRCGSSGEKLFRRSAASLRKLLNVMDPVETESKSVRTTMLPSCHDVQKYNHNVPHAETNRSKTCFNEKAVAQCWTS